MLNINATGTSGVINGEVKLQFDGNTLTLEKSYLQSNQVTLTASSTTTIVTGSVDLITGEMNTIIFDYVVWNYSNNNMRAGTFRSTAIGGTNNFVFDETTTTDIGDTSGLTLQAAISTGVTDKLIVEGVNAEAYNYTLQYFVREFRA